LDHEGAGTLAVIAAAGADRLPGRPVARPDSSKKCVNVFRVPSGERAAGDVTWLSLIVQFGFSLSLLRRRYSMTCCLMRFDAVGDKVVALGEL
jgi:hypothetical protein